MLMGAKPRPHCQDFHSDVMGCMQVCVDQDHQCYSAFDGFTAAEKLGLIESHEVRRTRWSWPRTRTPGNINTGD